MRTNANSTMTIETFKGIDIHVAVTFPVATPSLSIDNS